MPFGLQHRNIDDNQSQQQWQNIFKVLVAAGWSFLLKDAKNFKLDVDLLVNGDCTTQCFNDKREWRGESQKHHLFPAWVAARWMAKSL